MIICMNVLVEVVFAIKVLLYFDFDSRLFMFIVKKNLE